MIDLFHFSPVLLAPGSIVLPGNWGRVVRNLGWSHGAAYREMALEHARLRICPEMPSRLDVAFATPTSEAAIAFGKAALPPEPNGAFCFHLLYRVTLLDPAQTSVLCDWNAVSATPGSSLEPGWADRYWRGAVYFDHELNRSALPQKEVLTTSPLRIEERLAIP